MANVFANRIIGYTTKRASELTANPANWRKHPEKQRRAVQASLRELGWIGAVVENVRTGFLVDGHERVWQALKNDEEVPVLQVSLSEAEEKLALAVFDPITYMAETDAGLLDELLQGVNTGESALQELLAELAETHAVPDGDAWGDAFGGLPNSDREPFKQITFTLHDSQAEQVDRAIAIAKKMGDFVNSPNQNSNGNALSRICELFVMEHSDGNG
jgi:hypothetical protein